MIDRIAIHKLVDRVLDELDEGENFVHLDISSLCIGVRAQVGKFETQKPYVINVDFSPENRYTMDETDMLIKKLDKLADANPRD